MSDSDGKPYSPVESPTTPAGGDSYARSHSETLKVMNPTPNGLNNHSAKAEGPDSVKKHSSEHKHNSSDHIKKKEHKSKEGSSSKEHKEKKHSSSHSDGSKSKSESSGSSSKHSSESTHKEDKQSSEKQNGNKPKSDNFKENEKVKDGSSKHKDSSKEKHKDKHKDKEHKSSSGEKDKHKSDKHKDKSEKHKDKSKHGDKEKHKEKHKHGDKEKHGEKDKHGEKSKHSDKDKHGEKKIKIKTEVESPKKPSSETPVKIKKEPESPKKSVMTPSKVKKEKNTSDDEDIPLQKVKREREDDGDHSAKVKAKKIKVEKKRKMESDYDSEDEKPLKKKVKKTVKKEEITSPKKRGVKKEKEEEEVWKWWEEEKLENGKKWKTLSHKGPVFAPPYERVPKSVKFYYDGKHMPLSEETEEVAGFYGRMLDHDYTSKEVFNNNFFKDWKKVMTPEEKAVIKDLKKCNFKDFDVYYKQKTEERKAMTKEEKLVIKKQNEEIQNEYGFCVIDGHKQKIANFRIEPPGLFRGRGEHPKMGMLKRRVNAEDILINIGKEAEVPAPPPGHKWKEVRHDNTVSWLSSWSENILGSTKYIMLNPSSKLKGEKDWAKYETARKLKSRAEDIRAQYTRDFKSKEMRVRQRAVALYFIDKLALRAGNEKDEETADTVGCCSLRVEHITLDDEKDGKEYVVSFDFLGKDSIRYENSVPVEKRAYKNLKLFMENKQPGDDLFDRLNTSILNKYLNDLMEGLTAKVFRTYNASKTLQEQLDSLTKEDMTIPEKILAYNRANRAVAILCNHQRAVPKTFSKSMEALKGKIDDKLKQIKECKKEIKSMKGSKSSAKESIDLQKKKKKLKTLEEQLQKLELQATDREENKQIALGTSKLNYLDPRISVAWCKKWDVPIEKVYNKTQRDKFRWAIEMAGPDYKF